MLALVGHLSKFVFIAACINKMAKTVDQLS